MSKASAACLAAGLIVTSSLAAAADAPAPIELQEQNFRAEIDGKPVGLYTIRNAAGMVVRLTNYGARIEQIRVPDRAGRLATWHRATKASNRYGAVRPRWAL